MHGPLSAVSPKAFTTRAEPYALGLVLRIHEQHDQSQQATKIRHNQIANKQAWVSRTWNGPGSSTPVHVLSSMVHG